MKNNGPLADNFSFINQVAKLYDKADDLDEDFVTEFAAKNMPDNADSYRVIQAALFVYKHRKLFDAALLDIVELNINNYKLDKLIALLDRLFIAYVTGSELDALLLRMQRFLTRYYASYLTIWYVWYLIRHELLYTLEGDFTTDMPNTSIEAAIQLRYKRLGGKGALRPESELHPVSEENNKENDAMFEKIIEEYKMKFELMLDSQNKMAAQIGKMIGEMDGLKSRLEKLETAAVAPAMSTVTTATAAVTTVTEPEEGIRIGAWYKSIDRDNFGQCISVRDNKAVIRFTSPDGRIATPALDISLLEFARFPKEGEFGYEGFITTQTQSQAPVVKDQAAGLRQMAEAKAAVAVAATVTVPAKTDPEPIHAKDAAADLTLRHGKSQEEREQESYQHLLDDAKNILEKDGVMDAMIALYAGIQSRKFDVVRIVNALIERYRTDKFDSNRACEVRIATMQMAGKVGADGMGELAKALDNTTLSKIDKALCKFLNGSVAPEAMELVNSTNPFVKSLGFTLAYPSDD